MRVKLFVLSALCATALSGCSTIRGTQDTIPQLSPTITVSIDTALLNFYKTDDAARQGMTRYSYRNYIIGIYTAAIDQEYRDFSNQLRSGDRGTALGFGLLQLGLAGATALANESAARDLGVATTLATGTGALVDEKVFFNRTMPAVIAAMDAERALIKAQIAEKMALPAERYGLTLARDDLDRLVRAGSISLAITKLTGAAEAERERNEADYSQVPLSCPEITATTGQLNTRFVTAIGGRGEPGNVEVRKAAAETLQIAAEDGEVPNYLTLANAFDLNQSLCDDANKDRFVSDLEELAKNAPAPTPTPTPTPTPVPVPVPLP